MNGRSQITFTQPNLTMTGGTPVRTDQPQVGVHVYSSVCVRKHPEKPVWMFFCVCQVMYRVSVATYNHTIWCSLLQGRKSTSDSDVLVVSESPPPDGTNTKFEYSLKIINPSQMSEFKNVDLRGQHYCQSLDELKDFITSGLPTGIGNVPNLETVDMGFVEPGHGGKGRKVWLFDDDVQKMYSTYRGKKRILLWCYTHSLQESSQTT